MRSGIVVRSRKRDGGEWALTSRESEIARLLTEGITNDEIAVSCSIATHTARFHVINIIRKTGARNRTHAACMWLRRVLEPLPLSRSIAHHEQ